MNNRKIATQKILKKEQKKVKKMVSKLQIGRVLN
tara:strand:+ start:1223 stop:1324 length:102 start_codon:yes stop_codon:yes gene_type:complete